MIVLSDGTTTVELSPDLQWSDEYDWHPVEQTSTRTITGAQVVQSATRIAGRPITLEPEDDGSAWMMRSTLDQLRSWAAVPGAVLELTLRGVARNVVFRHQDGAGLEAKPVVHYRDTVSSDFYRCTFRFMEI